LSADLYKMEMIKKIYTEPCRIWGSHGGDYEQYHFPTASKINSVKSDKHTSLSYRL
jgi:hypothetical protein